jgi:hypothetical protein
MGAWEFVKGELSLEEAIAGEGEGTVQIFLELGYERTVMGVAERGLAPVFAYVPVGLGAGFGVGADGIFRARDGMPRSEQDQRYVATRSAALPSEVRPGLVSALAELIKEGGTHANN